MTFHDFLKTVTWKNLVDQYLESLNHVELFLAEHGRGTGRADEAIEQLVRLYPVVKPLLGNVERLKQLAPTDATEAILSACGRVKRELPTIHQHKKGHA